MRDKDNQHSRLYYIILTIVIIAICVVVVILFNTLKTNRSHSTDRYADFTELKRYDKNKDWRIKTKHRKNKDILVTAIHGGGIEPGTTEIARRISNVGKYNFYTFEGLRKSNNDQLHVTSTHFNEPILDKLLKTLKKHYLYMDSLEMTLLFISEVKIKRCLTLSRKNYVKRLYCKRKS